MKVAGKVGLVYRKKYDESSIYIKNDVVTYKSNSYICLKTSQGNTPEEDGEFWHLFVAGASTGSAVYISDEEPEDMELNDIWIHDYE